MRQAPLEIGIDLGTTNSCIARASGGAVEILRNNEGLEVTPSAVWLDRKGRLHVGRRAREQFEADEENACLEFKLQMGTPSEKVFQRSGQHMSPVEMSAEVLKSLLGDARQHGAAVQGAVITVPADFDLPQCEATRAAARMAGLVSSPLLQEPVAAALAYDFQTAADGVLWLVYDLGGGTFDAAVIQLRDGLFRVVNHGGDKHLGGKLLDWAVVTELFVPALLREHPLEDFHRGNPRWRAAFAKLKMAAEGAKIRLSRETEVEVVVDPLCIDDKGERVVFEHEVTRADLERLLDPVVARSLNICKRVLAEKRLGPGDVAKVLLVGGPTLTPVLRQRLSDPRDGLGIPLEFGIDPMTIVAKGAALYASTQRLEGEAVTPAPAGTMRLQLEYQPVGSDPEPLVGGKVLAELSQDLTGYTIEFIGAEAHPPRRTGQIRLASKGAFVTNLWAEKGKFHTFLIELRDADGRPVPTEPDRLTYTLRAVPTDPPLIHSLGVATVTNEMDVFLPKGTALPARKRKVHRTAQLVRKGQTGDALRIQLVEGENVRRADRNRLIGSLVIPADQIQRDLPALTEVEITLEIDASRLLAARAYIPWLDQEFDQVLRFDQGAVDLPRLGREIVEEKQRLNRLRDQAEQLENDDALRVFRRLDEERLLKELDAALAAGRADPDAADKCQGRLLDLKSAIDEAEYALETPALQEKLKSEWAELQAMLRDHGDSDDKQRAELLAGDMAEAVASRDPELLNGVLKKVRRMEAQLNWQQPGYLMAVLSYLENLRNVMADPGLAAQLLERAHRARDVRDLATLREALQQLCGILPPEQRGFVPGHGGTTFS